MKKAMTLALMVGTLALVGCDDNKKTSVSKSNSPPPAPAMEAAPPPSSTPPSASVPPAGPGPDTVAAAAAGGKAYVVKKGDTLSKIAREECGGIQHLHDLIAANPGIDPNHIKVGQKINLP